MLSLRLSLGYNLLKTKVMKKITPVAFILGLMICLNCSKLFSQVSLVEIPLNQQIQESSLIIEGKVLSKESFWDTTSRNIYTINTIEVYKVFKGDKAEFINVITLGGTVGLTAQISSHSLQLDSNNIGVFMLESSNKLSQQNKGGLKKYEAYSGIQGFYKYNLLEETAINPFKKKKAITSKFYDEIMGYTKKMYTEIEPVNITNLFKSKSSKSSSLLVPSGITFTPTTSTAGTRDVLTINGTDFGGTQGTVFFSNADDGGATFVAALDSQVLTWTDTQITVEIPTAAGTGPIVVEDSSSDSATSASSLTITYAQLNPVSGGNAYQTQHINDNGSGGYTWEMFTDFFNDTEQPGARADFEAAIETWRCETDVNWIVSGSATTVDVIGVADLVAPFDGELDADGTNVVRFDNGSELEAGVLGRCTSWYSGCLTGGTPDINWFVSELDIVFDDGVSWHFGTGLPGFTQFDFRSVALHELGHGFQLGHVIDGTFNGDNLDDVMHYAISNSEQQRVLMPSNIDAANDVHSRSTTLVPCLGTSVMTDYTGSCTLDVEQNELETGISIYPNPAKETLFIKNTSYLTLKTATLFDVNGRNITEHDISEGSNFKTINISGISSGIYFIKIATDEASITRKLVIE